MTRLAERASGWLDDAREAARARFADRGFPTTREEDWRYTNLRPIAGKSFADAASQAASGSAPKQLTDRALAVSGVRLVFVNGRYRRELSDVSALCPGVQALGLADALADVPQLVQRVFGKAVDPDQHRFADWNTAAFADGALVRLEPGVTLDGPVELQFVTTQQDPAIACHPRVLILAEPRSALTVIEHHTGEAGAANLTNAVTEILVGESASVEHYTVQDLSPQSFYLGLVAARQDSGSRFVSHNVQLGGRLARNDIGTQLLGEDSSASLNGLTLADGRRHVDNHTQIDHIAPHTKSEERYRAMVAGRARSVFNGRVVVHAGADKTDARQTSDNLLLSTGAEADTKPELEIYADDVKCSHGATVGQLDDDALFYVVSRGVDSASARAILTFGFASEIVGAMACPPVREYVEQVVRDRLTETRS